MLPPGPVEEILDMIARASDPAAGDEQGFAADWLVGFLLGAFDEAFRGDDTPNALRTRTLVQDLMSREDPDEP